MGFIFGIINVDKTPVKETDVYTLGNAVKWDGFAEKIVMGDTYGVGYCWNTSRNPKAGIYQNENLIVVCDARIYNQEELLAQGINCANPETMFANAYQKWGERCANRFNGDFSVVIIDHQQRKAVLFRDHIGVRPLCYAMYGQKLIFTSHEFGIGKSRLVSNEFSENYLLRNVSLFFNHDYRQTFFKAVRRVIPGSVVSVTSTSIQTTTYWHMERIKRNKDLTLENTVKELREHLIKATSRRMEPGIIGTHLSGGIDSSGIAAILADNVYDKSDLVAYSWSPDEDNTEIEGTNEKEMIDDFTQRKRIRVRYCSENDLSVSSVLFHEPEFENMNIELSTMKIAMKDNVSILFSGWGGDEFVSLSLRGAINHIVLRFKLLDLHRWIRSFGIKSTLYRVWNEIIPLVLPSTLFDKRKRSAKLTRFFCTFFVARHITSFFFNYKKCVFGWGNRTGFMLRLLHNYHLPGRMDSWALYGERYGIEYKYPLLDKELLEFWFTIPVKHTYQTMIPRYLYREAMKGILPEMIRLRPNKQEFSLVNLNKKRREENIKKMIQMNDTLNISVSFNFINIKVLKSVLEQPDLSDSRNLFTYISISQLFRYHALYQKYISSQPQPEKSDDAEQEA